MTTELATSIKPIQPLQSEPIWWMGFTLDMPDENAEALFIERHGHAPRLFVRDDAILKVGPIEEER